MAQSRAQRGHLEEDDFHTDLRDSPFLSKTHQTFTTEPFCVLDECPTLAIRCSGLCMVGLRLVVIPEHITPC